MRQRTIYNSFTINDIGLHSGKKSTASFYPASINQGIKFIVPYKKTTVTIPAKSQYAFNSQLCTSIGIDDVNISMIEHLLAALNALQIDNLTIQLSSNEFPVLDGSSALLFDKLLHAGIKKQPALKLMYVITDEVMVTDDDGACFAKFTPSNRCIFDFLCDFSHRGIKRQHMVFELNKIDFRKYIAPSRTFGFYSDRHLLYEKGLALGANYNNCLILDPENSENQNELLFYDELVRHKILDAIGDIYLIGKRVLGKYEGYKAGHKLNTMLVQKLIESTDCVKLSPYKVPKYGSLNRWKQLVSKLQPVQL